ncbi:MAG: (2Fe-2S)-binding protein, partial [Microcystaceae cyanobacterium]
GIKGMYGCVCHAVTEKDIQRATCEGVVYVSQLSKKTGLGTQCGACLAQGEAVMKGCLRQGEAQAVTGLQMSLA